MACTLKKWSAIVSHLTEFSTWEQSAQPTEFSRCRMGLREAMSHRIPPIFGRLRALLSWDKCDRFQTGGRSSEGPSDMGSWMSHRHCVTSLRTGQMDIQMTRARFSHSNSIEWLFSIYITSYKHINLCRYYYSVFIICIYKICFTICCWFGMEDCLLNNFIA